MKKRIISILLCLVMLFALLPTAAFAAYSEGDIPGTTGTGTKSNPVIVNTFAEFKAAMESWDISYVKLVATNEILPVVEQYQAAIMVAGGPDRTKNLIIEGNSLFRTRLDSAVYDSLLYVYYDQTLNVSGNGSLTFCPNGTNGFNCVVRNEGVCNISDVTLIGDIGGATVYALAVVNRAGDPSRGGKLNITSGTYVGSTAMNGSGPYAAVRIVSGEAEISGGEFRSDIYPGITVKAGTNALAVEESASCVLTGGEFRSGIYVKNKNIASILGEGYRLLDTKKQEVSAQQSRCDYASVKAAAKTITHLGFSFDVPNDGEEYPDGAKDIGRVTGCPVGVKVVDVETVQFNKRISGTAKAGDNVNFGIRYEVLPGYEIASSYTAAINGESALKVVTSDGVRKVAFENGATIGYNPDIKIQTDLPDTVSYTVGGSIEAKVSATGSNLKYQWQLATDSGKKFNTYKDISGATSASLAIKNADESYDGKLLRCCVSNGNGNAYSKVATLKKGTANTITVADVTIPAPAAGQKVSAHKVWTPDAPEKYTVTGAWTKGTDPDGAAMGDNETFAAGQKYTAVLLISSKSGYTLADNFAVKVNGNSAVKYSGSATLQVWYYTFTCSGSTTITAADVTIPAPAAGQKVSAHKVWTPDAPEKYTVTGAWTKGTDPDGAAMGDNETFAAGQKYTAALLISAKSGYTLADNFAVKVNGNSAVKFSSSATSYVCYYTFTCPASGAPVITVQPTAVNVKAGESVTFSVTATGEKLTYQWYSTDGSKDTKIAGATGASYIISKTENTQNGLSYYCIVSNANGSVTSNKVKLTVNIAGAPVITVQPTAVNVKAGENVSFKVTATGENLSYQWYSVSGGAATALSTTDTCTVSNVQQGQSGTFYYCVVSNAAGSVSSEQVKLNVFSTDAACPFVDVPTTAYYYDAVQWAYGSGVTGGIDATHFKPGDGVSRAQVVSFLWRAAGSPVVDHAMSFSDVPAGKYYTEAVRWAVANGITGGTDATHFNPNGKCNRAQIVTFLYRYSKASPVSSANPFTDVKAGAYYNDAVLWAVANGVTGGTSATTFAPTNGCTRGQVVTFLYRWMVK